MAVWTSSGQLASETGDSVEQITATALPNNFNASEDSNTRDDRSDDRGPESEEAAMGTIRGRHFAFVGMERISGVMVYDVSDPFHPAFQQYINNRNFAVSPNSVCGTRGGLALATCATAGDLETEGVTFVPADDSPIGIPLLLVSHEASDSVTVYKIASLPVLPGDYNDDRMVDAADYVVWRKKLGTAAILPNDATPGVDATDYEVWRTHFGETAAWGTGAGVSLTVPETGSCQLLALAYALIFLRRPMK